MDLYLSTPKRPSFSVHFDKKHPLVNEPLYMVRKYQQYNPCFQNIFPFLMNMIKMNVPNNKMIKTLLDAMAYLMRKRWLRKAIKRKHQYWVQDSFIDKTDKQYNKFVPKPRMND